MTRRDNQLFNYLEAHLKPLGLPEEEIYLVYTCFVCVNANAKYLPGQRLIYLVYKLTSYLIRERTKK